MLESQLLSNIHQAFDIDDVPQRLADTQASCFRIMEALRCKHHALGIDERENLANATRSKYIHLRMNAQALKQRIRDRLCQQKFEIEWLEHAYRQMVNGGSCLFPPGALLTMFSRAKPT